MHRSRHSRMVVDLFSLLAVLTLGLLSPGPDFFLVLKNSVGGSRVRGFATVAGITAGLLVQMTAIVIGFTAVTPEMLRMVQLAGAVFLAWLGGRALFGSRVPEGASAKGRSPTAIGRSAFLEGLTCNLTNPKAFLFYVSLIAQSQKPEVSPVWRGLLPVIFVAHGAIAWSLVVLALQAPPVARRFTRAQRWLPRAFGAALLSLAAWVVWQAW